MITEQDRNKLLPCPFCGGEAHFDSDDDGWNWIECGSCRVATNHRTSAMDDCRPLLAEAWNSRAALQSQDREDAFCVWHNDPETDSTWETGCGNLFILNDGTPAENRMKFCCYCGKPIREAIDHARRVEGE